jgi:transposase
MRNDALRLQNEVVGALPIVDHVLRRLRFSSFLDQHLPSADGRFKLSPTRALDVLVRNLVVARAPLYSLKEWARDRTPRLLGLEPHHVALLNDDRVGRSLDRLFDADRNVLMTSLVAHMVKEFGVSLEELHNDSTSLSVSGEYRKATGEPMRGKPTLRITFGFSKDERPDLKQLVWILTVSADGAVPVHFKVADGNTEDSTTHVETWEALRRLVGSSRFLYVADCKLCTRENLKHIHDNHGRFVTVMPRSRKEDGLFKDWLQQHQPAWSPVAERPHPRLVDGPPEVVRACESPIPDSDGFRVVWYESTHKMERDAQARRSIIAATWKELEAFRLKLEGARPRFKSKAAVTQAVASILTAKVAARWFSYEVVVEPQERFRQEKRGRPGKNTRWRRDITARYRLSFALNKAHVDYDARCDGIFPLITNSPVEELAAPALYEVYKSKQPQIEKRHDLLKNIEEAVPIFLKNIGRIEALLFLLFVALLVQALVERELRKAMVANRLWSLPLYPEARRCAAPTTRRVLEVFEDLQRHVLYKDGKLVRCFEPELNPLQKRILELLKVPAKGFLRA